MAFKGRFDFKATWNKAVPLVKQISIEPFMFFLMFGYFVRVTTFQSLLINRACRVELHYSDEVCNNLNNITNKVAKKVSMTYGGNLYNGCMMFSTIPALVVSTFLGPWSDLYGRKHALIISTTGILIDAALVIVMTMLNHITPFYFLLSSLFAGIGGGLIVALSCVYSYMSHVTDEKSRPTRFAVLEFFFIMSTPLGTLIGGEVYNAAKYTPVMIVSAISFTCGLLWLIFMVKEKNERRDEVTREQMLRDLFKYDNIVQSYKTAIMPRPGNLRLQIWLLILVSVLTRMITIGSSSIGYYYVYAVFGWDVNDFARATTIFHFLQAIATVTIVPAFNLKYFLHEAAVGLIGAFSLMARNVANSVAVKPALIYYALFCGLLSSCEGIAIRSRMSKLVSKTELGRIFSLIATCEAFSPVLGTLIMTQIFLASSEGYAGLAFACAALATVPVAAVFVWMLRLPTTSYGGYTEASQPNMKELKEVSQFK